MSTVAIARAPFKDMLPLGRLLRIGAGLVLLSYADVALNGISWSLHGVTVLWLPNGLLVGALLCTRQKHWPPFLALFFLIDVVTKLSLQTPLLASVIFTCCNLSEVLLAAILCYPAMASKPDLTEAKQLRAFLTYAVLLAPAAASVLAALYSRLAFGGSFLQTLRIWFAADLLGIATVTPLYLSFHQGSRLFLRSYAEAAGLLLLLCGVSAGIFRMAGYPMLWVVLLCLLALGVRLGFTASAMGLLAVACIGGYYTVTGYGPFHPVARAPLSERIFLFQCFIGLSMLALYGAEVATTSNRRMRQVLEASETRFRLLTEASRDIIVLADIHARHQYVSPAVTELLGWEPDELLGRRLAHIAYPTDARLIEEQLRDAVAGKPSSSLAFRSPRRDGSYLWLEATVRLIRDRETQEPSGFVYVLRDIADRKAAEEKLQQAVRAAQNLAMLDGLTGVPNRRLLDQVLQQEWLRGMREQTPLSLLLIDVDHFKLYNDLCGHLAGDNCLREIAQLARSVLKRPSDLLARYGGEEFVILLPNTDLAGARVLAEQVRGSIRAAGISHPDNPTGTITVSIGCAAVTPRPGGSVEALLLAADTALYRAKSGGRNRVESSQLGKSSLPLPPS